MKERLLKVIKIILIIFGVLFLFQILIFCLMILGISGFNFNKFNDFNFDFDKISPAPKSKEIMPIIKYAEDYQLKNNKYPEKIENVKVKDKLNYTYEVTKDGDCYTITVKDKNKNQEYRHCKVSSDNSSSTSESWAEYSD